jgi:glutaminyl-peptide cyclotransferase
MSVKKTLVLAVSLPMFLVLLTAEAQTRAPAVPAYGYQVVRTYSHDSNAFTQGLIYLDGFLYESTGQRGQSTVRKVQLDTGKVLQEYRLVSAYFAEGLTHWASDLVQLTWQENTAFIYDRASLKMKRSFTYSGEGWGLTQDGTRLMLSDGSSAIRFFDPQSFKETGRITVRDRGQPVVDLNELEYVRGEIYANVWHTNRIARISPKTGDVLGWIDLTGLLKSGEVSSPEAVLNGIAYDSARDRLFVTGKLWPKLFEI